MIFLRGYGLREALKLLYFSFSPEIFIGKQVAQINDMANSSEIVLE